MDVALVENKTVTQVWRNSSKKEILATGFSPKGMGILHEFDEADGVVCGMVYKDKNLTLPEVKTSAVESLTRVQLLRGLLRRGYITPEEAMNDPMEVPAFIQQAFSGADPVTQAEGIVQWRSAPTIGKGDTLFAAVLPALGKQRGKPFGAKEVDEFFSEFGKL